MEFQSADVNDGLIILNNRGLMIFLNYEMKDLPAPQLFWHVKNGVFNEAVVI